MNSAVSRSEELIAPPGMNRVNRFYSLSVFTVEGGSDKAHRVV